MKLYNTEVSEDKILNTGKESVKHTFLVFLGIATAILVGGCFWVFVAIIAPFVEEIPDDLAEMVRGCYLLFALHAIAAIVILAVGIIQRCKANPFEIGKRIVEEKCRVTYEKEFNAFLDENKLNYGNDASIKKFAFYVFQEKPSLKQPIGQLLNKITGLPKLTNSLSNPEPKEFAINGNIVFNNKIDHVEKYTTEYIERIVYFKYVLYLQNGLYLVNRTQIELNNQSNTEMIVILGDDDIPIIASNNLLNERCDAKMAAIISEEKKIKSITVVREELIDGPRMINSRKNGNLAEYEYRRYVFYYADGHTEVKEEMTWVRDLNGFGDPYR